MDSSLQAVTLRIDNDLFAGRDRGYSNGVEVGFLSQWLQRYRLRRSPRKNWVADLILHGGGSLGNLLTYANAGAEWRFGPELPDNFGSAPLLPAAVNTAPERSRDYSRSLRMHGFVILDLQLVAHDITLDGNSGKDSRSVDRKPLVAELGVGVAATYGKWQIAFARYLRSREFDGQSENSQLGSLTIRRDF